MHSVGRRRRDPIMGDTLWRNPTHHKLKIRFMNNGGHFETKEVEPGGTVNFPKAWGEATTKKVCHFLVTEEEHQATLKDRAALSEVKERMANEKPAAPPPPPTEPLGDASQPRTVTDDKGKQGDSERSSGDALEKFAEELEASNSYEQLQEMARGLEVSAGGKKIDIARRLATKMAE